MIEIRFDKTKDEVALLIWFLVDHSVEGKSGHFRVLFLESGTITTLGETYKRIISVQLLSYLH
jgi:hypothetical protein